jgi:hypothetical protein
MKSRSARIISRVVPFFPGVGETGLGRVSVETDELVAEEDELADKLVVVAAGEVVGDSVEGEDEAEGLENKPCISKRLRSFHIV